MESRDGFMSYDPRRLPKTRFVETRFAPPAQRVSRWPAIIAVAVAVLAILAFWCITVLP